MRSIINPRTTLIASAILLAAFSRFLPHWPNFTPVAAIALFGGAQIQRKHLAFLIPLAAMFISDLFIGFHSSMWAVYLGFVITVILGMSLRGRTRPLPVAGMVLSSSVIFFLLTNFSSWMVYPIYSKDLYGLMTAYVAGLPFLLNSALGDLFYSGVLFGGFYFAQQRFPVLKEVRIKS